MNIANYNPFAPIRGIFGYLLLFFCCIECMPENSRHENVSPEIRKLFVFNEETKPLGRILSATLFDERSFLLSTNQGDISRYSFEGENLLTINNFGSGPGEYIKPSLLYVHKDTIYVWCSEQLKFILFDSAGIVIKEVSFSQYGINDFLVSDDYFYLQLTGLNNAHLIEMRDKNGRLKGKFGKQSPEDFVLSTKAGAGALSKGKEDEVLYCNPSDLTIGIIKDSKKEAHPIEDTEFKASKIPIGRVRDYSSDISETLHYISRNSVVLDLFAWDNYLLVKAETGYLNYKTRPVDISQRFDQYYVIDDDYRVVARAKLKLNIGVNPDTFFNREDTLFYIEEFYSENGDKTEVCLMSMSFSLPNSVSPDP